MVDQMVFTLGTTANENFFILRKCISVPEPIPSRATLTVIYIYTLRA